MLGRIDAQLTDARTIAYDEVAERQAALAGVAAATAELESFVDQLADRLDELSGLRLPAMGPHWSYDVSVRVSEGSQRDVSAGDAVFYVVRGAGRVYLPYGVSGHVR